MGRDKNSSYNPFVFPLIGSKVIDIHINHLKTVSTSFDLGKENFFISHLEQATSLHFELGE